YPKEAKARNDRRWWCPAPARARPPATNPTDVRCGRGLPARRLPFPAAEFLPRAVSPVAQYPAIYRPFAHGLPTKRRPHLCDQANPTRTTSACPTAVAQPQPHSVASAYQFTPFGLPGVVLTPLVYGPLLNTKENVGLFAASRPTPVAQATSRPSGTRADVSAPMGTSPDETGKTISLFGINGSR